jgi:hypothetical protein
MVNVFQALTKIEQAAERRNICRARDSLYCFAPEQGIALMIKFNTGAIKAQSAGRRAGSGERGAESGERRVVSGE